MGSIHYNSNERNFTGRRLATYVFTTWTSTPRKRKRAGRKTSVVLIDADTNGSGVASDTRAYTNNQPFVGVVRKGTGAATFKPAPISDTVNKDTGFSLTAQLIPDT